MGGLALLLGFPHGGVRTLHFALGVFLCLTGLGDGTERRPVRQERLVEVLGQHNLSI